MWLVMSTVWYAIVLVPFGWHQAPGLVQHLIARMLSALRPSSVLIVQYLDDVLFVRHPPDVGIVACGAASALESKGYIMSLKSELEPTQHIA